MHIFLDVCVDCVAVFVNLCFEELIIRIERSVSLEILFAVYESIEVDSVLKIGLCIVSLDAIIIVGCEWDNEPDVGFKELLFLLREIGILIFLGKIVISREYVTVGVQNAVEYITGCRERHNK